MLDYPVKLGNDGERGTADPKRPLIYLDSAATTQKPQSVIDAMSNFYAYQNANIHRGIYQLAEQATDIYEEVRTKVAAFINAKNFHEIIFTSGTTEAINLVAASYGGKTFTAGDEIILSTMEHHSNIVPWQLIAEKTGAKIVVISINERGELDLEHYEKLISNRTKMVTITHISNVLGTVNPIGKICKLAHASNIPVLVDGAQAAAHLPIDVQQLDCDFYVFSAHKLYGPMGVGVLYGRAQLLDSMPPYHSGGGMIEEVTFARTSFAKPPRKFEAGTPNVAGVIGLGSALGFINSVGLEQIMHHESQLLEYATEIMRNIAGLNIIGQANEKIGVISFTLDFAHSHDIATVLDSFGLAVRAGHHCAMPLMDFYGIPSTTRASLGVYNTKEDIDALVVGIDEVKKLLTSASR